jgi:hypothetical protein
MSELTSVKINQNVANLTKFQDLFKIMGWLWNEFVFLKAVRFIRMSCFVGMQKVSDCRVSYRNRKI